MIARSGASQLPPSWSGSKRGARVDYLCSCVGRLGHVGVGSHEAKKICDTGDVLGDVRLIAEQGSVTLFFGWMIAVHGANGTLSHMTGHNEHSLPDEKDALAKIAVGKKSVHMLQFLVGQDAALGDRSQMLFDVLPRALVKEPKARHGGIVNHRVVLAHFPWERFDNSF